MWISLLLASSVMAKTNLPDGFVFLHDIDPSIQVDLRYFGSNNFIGRPIAGYKANKCVLTRMAAEFLKSVQADLKAKGLGLLVFDCYRPQKAVNEFMEWAKDNDQKEKARFYPDIEKFRLVPQGYIAAKSGHSRGSTVDLTLVQLLPEKKGERKKFEKNCASPKRKKDPGLDMGTNFDCFGELSHTINKDMSYRALGNRKLLKLYMEKSRFSNYEKEWWHYTLKNEPFPDQFFDFDIE